MLVSHTSPTGDLARNPGMCPHWEWNLRPFGSQASIQSTKPHQPGLNSLFFRRHFLRPLEFWALCKSLRIHGNSYSRKKILLETLKVNNCLDDLFIHKVNCLHHSCWFCKTRRKLKIHTSGFGRKSLIFSSI